MKDKISSFVWSFLLSFAVSFGAVSCLITGFQMAVDLGTVALWSAVASALCSLCYSMPLGLLPISALSLICGVLWQQGPLETSFEALLYRISRQYHKAYDWGVIKLNHLVADEMELQLWLIVCILAVVIAMVASRCVCRGKSAVLPSLTALTLLAACLVVTDTVPNPAYLFILLFALILLVMTSRTRRQDSHQGNRLCAMLAIPVAAALLLLFVFIPPSGYTGTEAPRRLMDRVITSEPIAELLGKVTGNSITGTTIDVNTVSLPNVGVRTESNAEIMQVLTDYTGTLYLRGRALDSYDGTTWTDSSVSTEALFWPNSKALERGGEVMITTRYAHRMLYTPYYVQSVDMTDVTRGMANDGKLTQYSFTCSKMSTTNDYFKIYTASVYDQEDWELQLARYLHLGDSVWQWAEPLAQEIIGDEETYYGRAQAIGDYVRNAARYDTNTYPMPSGRKDFAQWFLEDSETGYCVHFATSATVLLQAAGIPARYVTGYAVDATAEHVTVVRAKDAHAWTEYWLPGYGWMVLEATPPRLDSEPQQTTPTQQTGEDITMPTQAAEPSDQETQTPSDNKSHSTLSLLWLIPVLGGLVGLIVAQWQLRLALRRRWLATGTTNQKALACWQELARLSRHLQQPPDPDMFALAQKAKFSQYKIRDAELAQLESALADSRQALTQRHLLRRLYDRLVLALY